MRLLHYGYDSTTKTGHYKVLTPVYSGFPRNIVVRGSETLMNSVQLVMHYVHQILPYPPQLRACINNYNIVNSPDQIHGKLIANLVAAVQ